jgi:hypothetical protein
MLRGICLFLTGLSKNAVAQLMSVFCQSVCNGILKLGDPDKLLLNFATIARVLNNHSQFHDITMSCVRGRQCGETVI